MKIAVNFYQEDIYQREPEQRIKDIANTAEKYLHMPGFAQKFEE